jgi:hypothetical protein
MSTKKVKKTIYIFLLFLAVFGSGIRDGKNRYPGWKKIGIWDKHHGSATVTVSENLEIRDYFNQGCGSGSGLNPDSIGSVDPDPDPGGQKRPAKVEKNL